MAVGLAAPVDAHRLPGARDLDDIPAGDVVFRILESDRTVLGAFAVAEAPLAFGVQEHPAGAEFRTYRPGRLHRRERSVRRARLLLAQRNLGVILPLRRRPQRRHRRNRGKHQPDFSVFHHVDHFIVSLLLLQIEIASKLLRTAEISERQSAVFARLRRASLSSSRSGSSSVFSLPIPPSTEISSLPVESLQASSPKSTLSDCVKRWREW